MILHKLIGLSVISLVSLVIFYLSRFWIFKWWSRKGLFEIDSIKPSGGLLGHWLAGTPFQPFELLIWAGGVFLLLTFLQKLFQKFDS